MLWYKSHLLEAHTPRSLGYTGVEGKHKSPLGVQLRGRFDPQWSVVTK